MNKIKELYANKWVKFTIVAVCYLLWVIWLSNYWFLLGLGVIYDLYITKKVPWAFWKMGAKKRGGKMTKTEEWVDAIIFAVIAATFIRMFFIEAYTIPTPSMERELLVGDYLFVSKFHYGPKLPQTPLSIPFIHNAMPFSNNKVRSFSDAIQLDYRRLSGLQDVERNDIVVFNFPEGDTVVAEMADRSYYELEREAKMQGMMSYKDNRRYTIVSRPVDKKDNYIKRCVAVAGDTFEVRDGDVYINDEKSLVPEHVQYSYFIKLKAVIYSDKFLQKTGLHYRDMGEPRINPQSSVPIDRCIMHLTYKDAEKLKKNPLVASVVKNVEIDGQANYRVFPHDNRDWNIDNYGPMVIPAKGATVELNEETMPLYRRIIGVYEHNDLVERNGEYIINGEKATSYTFKQDYYWMMGDNRHNSLDSRFWGFVPEDHIVGKPMLIWLSTEPDDGGFSKIRWSRLFTFL